MTVVKSRAWRHAAALGIQSAATCGIGQVTPLPAPATLFRAALKGALNIFSLHRGSSLMLLLWLLVGNSALYIGTLWLSASIVVAAAAPLPLHCRRCGRYSGTPPPCCPPPRSPVLSAWAPECGLEPLCAAHTGNVSPAHERPPVPPLAGGPQYGGTAGCAI